jgi:hypothetical protein
MAPLSSFIYKSNRARRYFVSNIKPTWRLTTTALRRPERLLTVQTAATPWRSRAHVPSQSLGCTHNSPAGEALKIRYIVDTTPWHCTRYGYQHSLYAGEGEPGTEPAVCPHHTSRPHAAAGMTCYYTWYEWCRNCSASGLFACGPLTHTTMYLRWQTRWLHAYLPHVALIVFCRIHVFYSGQVLLKRHEEAVVTSWRSQRPAHTKLCQLHCGRTTGKGSSSLIVSRSTLDG